MYLSPMCEISNTHYLKKFLNKLVDVTSAICLDNNLILFKIRQKQSSERPQRPCLFTFFSTLDVSK